MRNRRIGEGAALLVLGMICLGFAGCGEWTGGGLIPVTTASEEARESYLMGRDLLEKLRVTDARGHAVRAVEQDPSFALAHLLVANTSVTSKEFFDSLGRAVELADQVSDAERSMILGFNAGVMGDIDTQKDLYTRLVLTHPRDERARNFLGGYYFGTQEWQKAIDEYRMATEINPDFSPPYNSLGYALRAIEEYEEAEEAFQKYIELIPDEPNPYDSLAELQMKTGRFEESIQSYEEALSKDPQFIPSYIGIGSNKILLGDFDGARGSFDRVDEVARNTGERRQAKFWTLVSHLHEENYDKALEAAQEMYMIAQSSQDLATMSGDLVMMGDLLLETGSYDEALAKYGEAMTLNDRSDAPKKVKAAARRNIFYNEARVALARGDLDTAKTITNRYGDLIADHKLPAEFRQHHELVGLVALEEKDYETAIEHLEQANQQDPRVLYELALACKAQGDLERGRRACGKAANWNGLGINFAYVRNKARALLEQI